MAGGAAAAASPRSPDGGGAAELADSSIVLRKVIAGAGAGALTKTAVAPLERIKVIFQVQAMHAHAPPGPAGSAATGPAHYSGVSATALRLWREEGLRAFWRGNGANVVRVIPVYALKFPLNDLFKDILLAARETARDKAGGPSSATSSATSSAPASAALVPPPAPLRLTAGEKLLAGSAAGFVQVVLCYPLDIARTRLQLPAAHARYTGIVDVLRSIVAKEGMRGVYKGLVPSLMSGVPYVGLQMTFFDSLKLAVPEAGRDADGRVAPAALLGAGATAGIAAQSIVYPIDTIRHRMQANGAYGRPPTYSGTWDCFAKTAAREGPAGFYKGYSVNLMRALPGAAVQFFSYEMLQRLLGVG